MLSIRASTFSESAQTVFLFVIDLRYSSDLAIVKVTKHQVDKVCESTVGAGPLKRSLDIGDRYLFDIILPCGNRSKD